MYRLRRLRKNAATGELFSEVNLDVKDLILPYFVIGGKNKKQEIKSMPGVFRLSIDNLIKDLEESENLGIKAILIFGIPSKKNTSGAGAYQRNGIVQKAIKAIRKDIKDIIIFTDVCLCGYTKHGHCGIVRSQKSEVRIQKNLSSDFCSLPSDFIDNDKTLKSLSKIALSHAEAGADFVAPSAMMDGQVGAIREALDRHGFKDTGILAYSAKYSSSFYGPFREALNSSPQFGDRKSYQMDFRNSHEALREIEQDINEGADIIMVKPALAYLDIIYKAKQKFNIPLAAYNVSGEYSLLKYGGREGLFSQKEAVIEVLTAIKRSGADVIITYHAKEAAKWLRH